MIIAWVAFFLSCVTWVALLGAWNPWAQGRAPARKLGSPPSPPPQWRFMLPLVVASLLLTTIWFWLWRPWFQPFWLHVFYLNPMLWLGFLGIGIACAGLAFLIRRSSGSPRAAGYWGTVVFVLVAASWGIFYGVMYIQWERNDLYHAVTYNDLAALPDTHSFRYLPREVAKRYGEARLQEPGVKLGGVHPLITDDGVNWEIARIPNGFWNRWTGNADGFAVVDNRGNLRNIRQTMKLGEGMFGTHNILWKPRQQRYWSKITNVYYLQRDDAQVVAVAPYLDYSFKFPVMVPRWGGVFLVSSNGEVQNLGPKEAADIPSDRKSTRLNSSHRL